MRLWFLLRSLWPSAEMTRTVNWESTRSQLIERRLIEAGKLIVIDASNRATRPTSFEFPDRRITQVAKPLYFERRQLRAYLVSNELARL